MKKFIILLTICLTLSSCEALHVSQSKNGVQKVLPPGAENFKETDKIFWYSFTRNDTKYLIYYKSFGGYSNSVVIMEDK